MVQLGSGLTILFDLTILPISIESGREQYELPGFLVMGAPKKTSRLRAQDHLLLYCRFLYSVASESASLALTPAQQREILTKLADTYFDASGSVTSGLRAIVARLNEFLLDRNLRNKEGQTVAVLNVAALHGNTLIAGHAGPAHTFVLAKKGFEHFCEETGGGAVVGSRGLGLSRAVTPHFYEASLESGDLVVICDHAPATWNARALAGSTQLSFDALRRRILGDASDPFQAAVVRFQEGKGQVSYWRPTNAAVSHSSESSRERRSVARGNAPSPVENANAISEDVTNPAGSPSAVAPATGRQGVFLGESSASPSGPLSQGKPASSAATSVSPRPSVPPVPIRGKAPATQAPLPPAGGIGSTRAPSHPEAKKPQREPRAQGLRHFMGSLWKTGQSNRARINAFFALVGQKLPKRRDTQGREIPFFNLSHSTMLAIALVIPLVVAAVASTVYFHAGREQQFQLLFLQAQQAAEQAAQQSDPGQQKIAWGRVYELTGQAEAYQVTDATRALKRQALATLDSLDNIVRLDYQPAVTGGFAQDVRFTRIVSTVNDVYLLDATQGRVYRVFRTATGYEVDTKFVCGGNATPAGATQIGPLVDIVALSPSNPHRYSVMGIDSSGNLALCKLNSDSFDVRTLVAPDSGWGTIMAMTISDNSLYVLDPKGNAIYRYDLNQDGDYANAPHFYFDNEIPKMADVIDFASDQEFIYLLHSDGSMTLCGSGAGTRCTDPTPYGDPRAGYESSPLSFVGTQFVKIETTDPPDPSLYALDAKNRAIFHFSLRRLNLQRQYLPQPDTDFPLPSGAPTAFAITPNHRALIAFNNQVFFAPLP